MEGSPTDAPIKINPEFTAGRIPEGLDEIEVVLVKVQPETPKWKGIIHRFCENTAASIVASIIVAIVSAYIGFQIGATDKTIVREAPQPIPTQSCEPTRYARSK
jgi:hypothetical protein